MANSTENETELEIRKLLKNINSGVNKLSLKKFNTIISKAIVRHTNKSEFEIEEVIKIVCKYYRISDDMLNTKSRGEVYQAKIICFKILNHSLGISAQRIGKYFKRYPNSITHALKVFETLDPKRRQRDKKIMEDFYECDKRVRNLINENNN
jgi:chromosomal replication initiation ATPase DnaA